MSTPITPLGNADYTAALDTLKRTLDEKQPGPGTVSGSTEISTKGAPPSQLVTLPYTEEDMTLWIEHIKLARARTESRSAEWDMLLKAYLPTVVEGSEPIKVMTHFRNIHTKMGQLFVKNPELVLQSKDPGPMQNTQPDPMAAQMAAQAPPGAPLPPFVPIRMEDLLAAKQAILNDKLGPDGIQVDRLMDEQLFDCMGYSGISPAKLGYRCVFKNVQQPKMMPAPIAPPQLGAGPGAPPMPGAAPPPQPGAPSQPPPMVPVIDPATGQPVMETVPVPIFEEWYARRFSAKKLLVPWNLQSTRFDKDAIFLGMDFYISKKQAMRPVEQGGYGLTEDQLKAVNEDDKRFKEDKDAVATAQPSMLLCSELWLKASEFTDEPHPEAICQLILMEGIKDKPLVWRASPDQEFDPTTGKLTRDSLIGFPITILALRDLTDSPFPQADSAFNNNNAKQLTVYRQQDIAARDARIGNYLYDSGILEEDAEVAKLKTGTVGQYIAVAAGALKDGADKVLTTTAQIRTSPDDYRGASIIKQDSDEVLGISSVQAGTPEQTVRSATETASVAQAFSGRVAKERNRAVSYYLEIARKIDQLLMRYATVDDYVEVAGEDGGRQWMIWNNKVIQGRFMYDISPDSQLSVDTGSDLSNLLKVYNLLAPDPLTNRAYLQRRIARAAHLNPAKVIATDQMRALQAGMPQPPHGGAAVQGNTVSQHEASNTGQRPNEPGAENARQQQPK